jgi:predicted nuclease of predicted toxin-antitoxin system
MTSFLADENVPHALAEFLRQKGFDVKEARELGTPSISDRGIIELARREERILVTFDRHFANLLIYPLDNHYGIIRIRIHPPLLSDIIQSLEHFLLKFDLATIKGTLIVLEREGYRVRRSS